MRCVCARRSWPAIVDRGVMTKQRADPVSEKRAVCGLYRRRGILKLMVRVAQTATAWPLSVAG